MARTASWIIVGAGLAGACAAAALRQRGSVLVIDARGPAAGASGAAAGLANPFAGRRAAPGWRHDEALAALHRTAEQAGAARLIRQPGILRPAQDERQRDDFCARAAEHPHALEWLPAGAVAERWPDVAAPSGGLWVRRGAAVDIPALVDALLADVPLARQRVTRVGQQGATVWAETATGERLEAERLLLAPGAGFGDFAQLAGLPLGRVKGQVAVVRPARPLRTPLLAGNGYAVPSDDGLVIGSTYEHEFEHARPTSAASRALVAKLARTVPALEDAVVLDARAGVRVTVPARLSARRLPMLGPVPGHDRIWGMVGLGSKGLLSAPLLAEILASGCEDSADVPAAIRLRIDGAART